MKITIKNLFKAVLLGIVLLLVVGSLNKFVMHHNHGTMPVWVINEDIEESLIFDTRHSVLTEDTQYKFLCDIFVIPVLNSTGIEYEGIMSPGDLFIFAGQSLICLAQILVIWIPLRFIGRMLIWIFRVRISVVYE